MGVAVTPLPNRSLIWKTYPSSLSNTPSCLQPSLEWPRHPIPTESKFLPEQWDYTDGSDITGHSRLVAAVVHIPTNTTIYLDAAETEETRTIMRTELVAIHTTLTTFATHD